ncbi:PilZ domain-containing protein [Vibrio sonorensis]|uniref:PilZ domain-containing protein n=1 Tax=Vibrio sonorensis TaxID=1004316 RepID=UPI0008D94C98|nr:PilZ domain-containing protein [Vibrio sonorensis]
MTEQEFFSVNHQMNVNVELLDSDFVFPSFELFTGEIPTSFIVASEFTQLDHLNELAHAELKTHDLKSVVTLLDNQNAKLNLLLTYMLSQQDIAENRYQTTSFGASQFNCTMPVSCQIMSKVRVKLFLEHPAAAIYCYAHVTECEESEQGFLVTFKYDLLRDEDQDLLIKAALYQQQKLLRQRSLNRDKQ